MDKMRMESVDMTAQNIDKIGAMFPNCITETVDENGKPKKAINFELLKQMLSGDVLEGDEAYEFTWVGKKAAIVEANKPIRKILRPCVEESKDWDTTENLYIEGDNLEVLKLLQESYLGKVKMIYIDPPYNTGNDSFVYSDSYKMDQHEYEEEVGLYEEEVNKIFREKNETNPRFHSFETPSGRLVIPPSGSCWRLTKDKMVEAISENRIWFGQNGDGVPRIKKFLTEGKQGLVPETMWLSGECGTNDSAKRELTKLFTGKAVFETPKPVELLIRCLQITNDMDNEICMDFFSGTAPLSEAAMKLNAEDGDNRKFIMVQLPEECAEDSEAYKAGYKNICEIGKERIRRAGDKIKSETGAEIDYGFRVLKLEDSNMTDAYYAADEYDQEMLSTLESNIKSDRTDLDLLFSCLLEWGLPLSMPYCSEQIAGCTVHTYNDGDLIACFDENVPDSVVKAIAKRQPLRAVFRDSSFANSPAKINVTEIFKLLAPDTRVKVL